MLNREIRIALVRLSALGDIVNSAVVLQLIKQRYPNARIDWITEEPFAPLLEGHPLLNAVHTVPLKRIKKERSFTLLKQSIAKLRALGPYDLVIDMQGLIKSAVTARLLGANVHGYDRASAREPLAALFYRSTTSIPYEENIVRRNCRVVADALGFEITDEEILAKEAVFPIGDFPDILDKDRKNVVCVMGASWPSKQFPKEKFAQLCLALEAHCILVWGSEEERVDAEWVAAECTDADVAPALDLKSLCSLIGRADLTVGNDTGPTHMAWAQNRPSLTLFGPTNTRMIFETPQNLAIESDSTVDITRIDRSDFSIREIPVEVVINAARSLL